MKPLFKNITKYTEKNFQQFVNFHETKFTFKYNLYTIAMSLLILYCIVLSAIKKEIKLLFVFIAILILFLIIRIYIPNQKYIKTKKDLKSKKASNFVFVFYNNFFTIGKKRFYYFKLHKVYETKDYFYIYVDEDNAALVSKIGFTQGTPKDFSEFIKKKCLLKYNKETS